MEIIVTPEDIAYAEGILLSDGEHFDADERVAFINNFSTLDLQAIPGSGKTTALLAKLLVLERKLPFEDGSGILVLSHTNTAVEEIEKKIKKHCPKLFDYPNHIGTIQSFVDKYLAIPFYRNCYNNTPSAIDPHLHYQRLQKWFLMGTAFIKKSNEPLFKKLWSIWHSIKPYFRIRFGWDNGHICLIDCFGGNKVEFKKPRRAKIYTDYTQEEKDEIYNWVYDLKKKVFIKEAVLHYDDAYFLANSAIKKNSLIVQELRLRFPFVFVDEMQDMGQHQIDLLEELFFNEAHENICYQRIGDKNQAIYGDIEFEEEGNYWTSENRAILCLTGTHRLTPTAAAIVEKFGVVKTLIHSLKPDLYNPVLILYSEEHLSSVMPLFSKIVSDFKEQRPELFDDKHPIKAIGWRKDNDKGITLTSYFPQYTATDSLRKQKGISLWADLKEAFDKSIAEQSLKFLHRAIWKGLQIILRLENYKGVAEISSINRFQEYLQIHHPLFWDDIEEKLYTLICQILESDFEEGYAAFEDFIINKFLPYFGLPIKYCLDYLNNKFDADNLDKSKLVNKYVDEETNLEFEVCTVHSVKGETHSATLYLETYYDNDSRKGEISYESQRLIEQMKGVPFPGTERRKRRIQSAKMVYVGFSRAKHILCFAANNNHFTDSEIKAISKMGWQINKDLV